LQNQLFSDIIHGMKVNEKIAFLEKVIKQKDQQIKLLTEQNNLLNNKVDYLIRQMFGKKSEIIDSAQLLLSLEGIEYIDLDEDDDDTPPPTTPRPKKKRKYAKERLPENLPEVREYIDDPDEVKADPSAYNCIGEEETTKLEVTPARFFKKIKVRRKFVKKDGKSAPVASLLPPQFIDKSIASESLLAHIAVSKYVDHLPLYRQEQMFLRQGIEISRKRMSDWMWQAANWLNPIYDALRNEIIQNHYIQVDETPVQYLIPGSGKSHKGYLWAYNVPGIGVVFEWYPSRAATCLHGMLNDYNGLIQTDGYKAYDTYNRYREASGLKPLEHAACLAHARRNFFIAQKESDLAKKVLLKINRIYKIERDMRKAGMTGEERQKVRSEKVEPIFSKIKNLLDSSRDNHLPQSDTGKAIRYALNLWNKLSVFIKNGNIEPDNNLVENAIRPIALGKKNWLFFGSSTSGQQSAVIYSIVETCRRLGINPYEYLLDVFNRLPSMTNQNVEQLTPSRWLAKREQQKIAS